MGEEGDRTAERGRDSAVATPEIMPNWPLYIQPHMKMPIAMGTIQGGMTSARGTASDREPPNSASSRRRCR